MSSSSPKKKLQPIKVVQTLADVAADPLYAVLKGTKVLDMHQWATNSISNSNISWTTQTPSGLIVDKRMYVVLPVRLTFAGTSTGGVNLLQPGQDAPRSWPLANNLSNVQLTINGSTFSMLPYQITSLMQWFMMSRDVKQTYTQYSGTPTYPDQTQQYSALYGSNRSPFATNADCIGEIVSRGAFPFTIVSNSGSAAVVDMIIIEPLMIPPLAWDGESAGLANTNQINVTLNFINTGQRWWSHDSVSGATGNSYLSSIIPAYNTAGMSPAFTYANSSAPLLLIKYITPDSSLPPILNTNQYVYPYYVINSYVTDQTAALVAGGASQTLVANNLLLTALPKKMYICVRDRDLDLQSNPTAASGAGSALGCQLSDRFAQIQSVSITFNNVTGIYSSANQHQLYEMSVRNGLNMTRAQFSAQSVNGPIALSGSTPQYALTGSVIAMEFGTDLPIVDENLVPGGECNTNLQVQVTCANTGTVNMTPTILIVLVYEGTFTITGYGNSTLSITPLTALDIREAVSSPHISYCQLEKQYGGNFLDDLGKFAKTATNFLVNDVFAHVPLTAPFVKGAKGITRIIKEKFPESKEALEQWGLGRAGGQNDDECTEIAAGRKTLKDRGTR